MVLYIPRYDRIVTTNLLSILFIILSFVRAQNRDKSLKKKCVEVKLQLNKLSTVIFSVLHFKKEHPNSEWNSYKETVILILRQYIKF